MKLEQRIARATAACAVVDGLWAIVLTTIYGGTFAGLWQGVASVVVGREAIGGGAGMTALGLAMHVGVACAWSIVFALLWRSVGAVRSATSTLPGAVAVAMIYGPIVWATMSLVVIPLLAGRSPNVTYRWWIQLAGHAVFVGPPIVFGVVGRPSRT